MPTIDPVAMPTIDPVAMPTIDPVAMPTIDPVVMPKIDPVVMPKIDPVAMPTMPSDPTMAPSEVPAGATDGFPTMPAPGVADAGLTAIPSATGTLIDGAGGTSDATSFLEQGPAADPLFGMPMPGQPALGQTPLADPAVASQAHDTTVLQALAEYSPAARVLVSAAVISSVVGAQAATAGNGGARRLAFVNARLVPCLVKATIQRQIETLSLTVSRGGGTGAIALHDSGDVATGSGGGNDHQLVQRLFDQVSDGFHDVVDMPGQVRDGGESADRLLDARLMTQIGMVLGFVYLGFLTVWFWATRKPGEGRA
jgi:hypothetical protein